MTSDQEQSGPHQREHTTLPGRRIEATVTWQRAMAQGWEGDGESQQTRGP